MEDGYDIAVVGAGIVGIAHALAAARRGLKVVVIDRDSRAVGASIRNFGFVTVTGQAAGTVWNRALRSRDIWRDAAAAAGIEVVHRELAVVAHTDLGMAGLAGFRDGPMGAGCELLDAAELGRRLPMARRDQLLGGLWSPHELRIEPREALPRLAAWLAEAHGVTFRWRSAALAIAPPVVTTSTGAVRAARVVVCPGPDLVTLYPAEIARHDVSRTKLHMLRVAPPPGWGRLPAAVMTEVSLLRYEGYRDLAVLPALRQHHQARHPDTLANGIHLIVVQSADGSLVVGDSHHNHDTPDPFQPDDVDRLMLDWLDRTLEIPDARVTERWTGVYPISPHMPAFVAAPAPDVRLALVTSGTGMSTAFAIGEETIADLFG